MCDELDVMQLLAERRAWVKSPDFDWGPSVADCERLRLEPGDVHVKSGWTRREIDAAPITTDMSPAQMHVALQAFWLDRWLSEDAAKMAARRAADARQAEARALWLSQEPERQRKEKEQAKARAAKERRLEWLRTGPPRALNALTLQDLVIETDQQRKALAAIDQVFADDDALYGLAFLGTPGSGKSSMAALLLRRAFFELEHDVCWVRARDFAQEVRAEKDEERVIQRLEDCSRLVVDDIGSDLSDGAKAILAEVFDRRRQSWLTTSFTSNLTAGQLRQIFTPPQYSRIMAGITVVTLTGRDYRLEPT